MIQQKQYLDVILRQAMCACILHNLIIDHPVPPDWFNETIEELDQDDELNQSVEQSGGCIHVRGALGYTSDDRSDDARL